LTEKCNITVMRVGQMKPYCCKLLKYLARTNHNFVKLANEPSIELLPN